MGSGRKEKKIVLSCFMAGFFFWVLYASWSAKPPDDAPGASTVSLRVIELELQALELSVRGLPGSRGQSLTLLSQRFHDEAQKDPVNIVLQIEDAILRYEADRLNVEAAEAGEYFKGLPDSDPALLEAVRNLYGIAPMGAPDQDLFLQRLGMNWFSLTALVQYAERIGDDASVRNYRESLSRLAWRTAWRMGLVSLFVAGNTFTGLWLWIRFFYRRLKGYLVRREDILFRVPWNFIDGLFVFLLFFTALTALSFLLNPLYRLFHEWGLSSAAMIPMVYGVQLILGLFLIRRYFFVQGLGQAFRTMGLFETGDSWGKTIRWGVGGYAATVPLVVLALYLSSLFLEQAPISDNPMIPMVVTSSSAGEKLLLFVTIGIMAPCFEEIFFRGFLFNAFRSRLGTIGGALLSAFLFASVHFDFSVFFGLFAIGIMLSTLYYQTQNLLVAVILHGLWNVTTLVTLELLFG